MRAANRDVVPALYASDHELLALPAHRHDDWRGCATVRTSHRFGNVGDGHDRSITNAGLQLKVERKKEARCDLRAASGCPGRGVFEVGGVPSPPYS